MLDLFLGAAERFPEREAFFDGAAALSYAQARDVAQATARALRSAGLERGGFCIVESDKGVFFWPAVLGVWMSGGIPVFTDGANTPAARMSMIAQTSGAGMAVADGPDGPVARAFQRTGAGPGEGPWTDEPSYAVFTSGSSGRPKGVLCPSAAAARVSASQAGFMGLADGATCLWVLRQGFDASLSDAGVCWAAGGRLAVFRQSAANMQALAAFAVGTGASYADIPPALMARMDPCMLPSLTTVLWGGERISPEALGRWSGEKRVFVAYGPSEAAVCTHMARCLPDGDPMFVGKSLPGVGWRVEDGELVLFGENVAFGYMGAGASESSRFSMEDGTRVFRTGDLVEESGGGVRFLGRLDRQFKAKGVLVRPEELETAAMGLGLARNCVFFRTTDGKVGVRAPTGSKGTLSEWRESLSAAFPPSMLPSRLIIGDSDSLSGEDHCKSSGGPS